MQQHTGPDALYARDVFGVQCHCTVHEHAVLHATLVACAVQLPMLHRLAAALGGVDALWRATDAQLRSARMRNTSRAAFAQRKQEFTVQHAEQQLREYAVQGYRMLCRRDPDYPALLREIAQPPFALYCAGDTSVLRASGKQSIAMVGSRSPSAYGSAAATQLSRIAARLRWTVVSGLARGVDALCHEAALYEHGSTIAVLGGGIAPHVITPARNQRLAERVVQSGNVLISEYPFETQPQPHFFPERNRIIAGISLVTTIIEASFQSGSLITARHALDENREVFALPGEIFQPLAQGCNRLLSQGAIPIPSIAEFTLLLEERSTTGTTIVHSQGDAGELGDTPGTAVSIVHLTPAQQDILRAIGHPTAACSAEHIAKQVSLSPSILTQELVLLEIEGVIAREISGEYRWLAA